MAESRTIGVFGAGWVGLVTGGCFAELGHEVVVRDVMPDRVAALQAGRLPFHEPDLPDVLARNRERIRYTLDAGDLAAADVLFICVQTPPTYSGDADLCHRPRAYFAAVSGFRPLAILIIVSFESESSSVLTTQ